MNTTSKFTQSTIGIPQHGTYWCIPAGIENIIRAERIYNIQQEAILFEYLISLNINISLTTSGPSPLSSFPRFQVLEYFRCRPIPNACFTSFCPIANSLLSHNNHSIRLSVISNIKTTTDYLQHLNNIISQNKPALISARNSTGWHITIAYQIDNSTIWSYDPGQDCHLVEQIKNYVFSNDILFVR